MPLPAKRRTLAAIGLGIFGKAPAMMATWALVALGHMAALGAAADFATVQSAAPDVIEPGFEGSINWTRHVWRVHGRSLPLSPALLSGAPLSQADGAVASAQKDAQAHLGQLRQSMYWGPPAAQRTGQLPAGSDATELGGHGRTIATQFFFDGHVAVTEDYSWDAPLAEALWQARQMIQDSEARHAGIQAPPLAPNSGQDAAPTDVLAQVPTGLIVNARGLKTRPALLPEVQDPAGAALYDARHLHPAALSRYGVARFSYSLDAAAKDERMGAHPCVVRAHAILPQAPWVFVVDARQAAIVQAAQLALSEGKVIFVIDEMDWPRQQPAAAPRAHD